MAKFKKGQSGNPKGRPKGTTTLNSLLKKIGSEEVKGTDADKLEFIMRKVFDFAVNRYIGIYRIHPYKEE